MNRPSITGDKNPAKRPEVRKAISESKLGTHLSEEHKAKLRAVEVPEVARERMSRAKGGSVMFGRKVTRAYRAAVMATLVKHCQCCRRRSRRRLCLDHDK